jgi:molybdopterin-containing oxidoreductase family iron-sulfur binding subunit
VAATWAREEDGIVVIDKTNCIGCKTCMAACPYGARYLIVNSTGYHESGLNEYEQTAYAKMQVGKVDKCDFCIEYSGTDQPDPQCVKTCICEARIFGDLEEIKALSEARGGYTLYPEMGTYPKVYYLPPVQA